MKVASSSLYNTCVGHVKKRFFFSTVLSSKWIQNWVHIVDALLPLSELNCAYTYIIPLIFRCRIYHPRINWRCNDPLSQSEIEQRSAGVCMSLFTWRVSWQRINGKEDNHTLFYVLCESRSRDSNKGSYILIYRIKVNTTIFNPLDVSPK